MKDLPQYFEYFFTNKNRNRGEEMDNESDLLFAQFHIQ